MSNDEKIEKREQARETLEDLLCRLADCSDIALLCVGEECESKLENFSCMSIARYIALARTELKSLLLDLEI